MNNIKTLGDLKRANYPFKTVKQELRDNLIIKLRNNEKIFQNIVGYEKTVIPQLQNAILSKHDFILLGLRGQAKTRLIRGLSDLLDEEVPIIKGSSMNEHPYHPITKFGREQFIKLGDDIEIEWLHKEFRYNEKLATPDVSMADMIGDIDPIKAANRRLEYSDEEVIHYGLIPRSNRGIFAINELPDLQARIQVGLLNILEEKDIQIRGFPVRIPMDILMVFTANPEDYTNRGNIITPLKDRINSQILTHYPQNVEDAIQITQQESWVHRDEELEIPYIFKELVEEIAFEARNCEFVDQASGVSARMTISIMENLISNAERRKIRLDEKDLHLRICDLFNATPSITGKLELVYEGEKEGAQTVAKYLIGKAIKKLFQKYFPDPFKLEFDEDPRSTYYREITGWFASHKSIQISDETPFEEYFNELSKVQKLKEITSRHCKVTNNYELSAMMELVLEGLHQNSMISKKDMNAQTTYKELLNLVFDKAKRKDFGQDSFY